MEIIKRRKVLSALLLCMIALPFVANTFILPFQIKVPIVVRIVMVGLHFIIALLLIKKIAAKLSSKYLLMKHSDSFILEEKVGFVKNKRDLGSKLSFVVIDNGTKNLFYDRLLIPFGLISRYSLKITGSNGTTSVLALDDYEQITLVKEFSTLKS